MDNTHTEFLTFNGHREVIEGRQWVIDQLISEGWFAEKRRCYPDTRNGATPATDYITQLLWKDFIKK